MNEFKITEKIKIIFTDAQETASDLILRDEISSFFIDKYNKRQEEFVIPINTFNEMIANSPNLESTLLPIGDGLTIAIKYV